MDPQDIQLVQSTFERVHRSAEQVGQRFYQRLFELAPEVRPLFQCDPESQCTMFVSTLGLLVNGLDDSLRIYPAVRSLGVRHVAYGARAGHYAQVGEVLIETLREHLGDEFTPAVEAAWREAYRLLSGVMMEAMLESASQT